MSDSVLLILVMLFPVLIVGLMFWSFNSGNASVEQIDKMVKAADGNHEAQILVKKVLSRSPVLRRKVEVATYQIKNMVENKKVAAAVENHLSRLNVK